MGQYQQRHTVFGMLLTLNKTGDTDILLSYLQDRIPNQKLPVIQLPEIIPQFKLLKPPSDNLQKVSSCIKFSGNKKVAIMFEELLKATSWLSTKYADPVKVKLFKAMPKLGRWTFRTYGNKKGSNPKGYLTKLKFVKKGRTRNIKKLDMKVHCNCFTGDTKIKLLNGENLSFEELIKKYGYDKEFYVYS